MKGLCNFILILTLGYSRFKIWCLESSSRVYLRSHFSWTITHDGVLDYSMKKKTTCVESVEQSSHVFSVWMVTLSASGVWRCWCFDRRRRTSRAMDETVLWRVVSLVAENFEQVTFLRMYYNFGTFKDIKTTLFKTPLKQNKTTK